MSPLLQSLGIDRMTIDERIRLVNDIWETVEEADASGQLTDAQKQEICRRVAEYEADPENVMSWDDLKRELRSRFSL